MRAKPVSRSTSRGRHRFEQIWGIFPNRLNGLDCLTEVYFERKTDVCQYHSVFPMPEEIGDLIDLELEFTLDVGYRLFDMLDDTAITKTRKRIYG